MWYHDSSHSVEDGEEGVEGVKVGLDGVLAVDLQLETAAEELEDHREQLVAAAHVLDMGQSAHGEDTPFLPVGTHTPSFDGGDGSMYVHIPTYGTTSVWLSEL